MDTADLVRPAWDHPRSRGADGDAAAVQLARSDHPRSRGADRITGAGALAPGGPPPLAGPTRPKPRIRLTSPDHPRSRGADPGVYDIPGADYGLPPLARGRPSGSVSSAAQFRTTPARAGPTLWALGLAIVVEDHPRSRGADRPARAPVDLVTDHTRSRGADKGQHDHDAAARRTPPPLARGRLFRALQFRDPGTDRPRSRGADARRPGRGADPHRTTPARAGPTVECDGEPVVQADHPRSRGADSIAVNAALGNVGPPPLARGRPDRDPVLLGERRTIPARAGPTPWPRRPPRRGRTTPARAGPTPSQSTPHWATSDPPPLARGRPDRDPVLLGERRTIPARAGPTPWPRRPASPRADHPRSRGADINRSGAGYIQYGPPPLARRRPAGHPGHVADQRTTPARAGPTTSAATSSSSSTDHPRSRGADAHGRWRDRVACGPPPLARGRRPRALEGPGCMRTTPARAGPTTVFGGSTQ